MALSRLLLLQGDPSAAPYAVDNAKAILGKKPVFGICMGHQILGQAFGGKTFKLKFGHHGGNHPIRYNPTGVLCMASGYHHVYDVHDSSCQVILLWPSH